MLISTTPSSPRAPTSLRSLVLVTTTLSLGACVIEEEPPIDVETSTDGDGDPGDGDPGDGDPGDGDPGDGDPGDGDPGDGDPGDGDPGDGDPGDGDGDPSVDPIAWAFPSGTMCDDTFAEIVGDTACYLDDDSVVPFPYMPPPQGPYVVGATLMLAEENSEGGLFYYWEGLHVPTQTFQTKFGFQFRNPGGVTDTMACPGGGMSGGDGFAFVLHEDVLGGAGGGLGIEGVANTVAVEFDTYCNDIANNDPSSSHIGIMVDGNVNHAGQPTAEINGDFEDGQQWWAWVDYDGTTISVYVAQQDVKPGTPTLTGDVDVEAITGRTSNRVGFTAATGLAYENAIITEWEFAGQP